MNHIFKKTTETFKPEPGVGRTPFDGWPIEQCVCGVKRCQNDLTTTHSTLRSSTTKTSTYRMYWQKPYDKRTGSGGWDEKAPKCTRAPKQAKESA